MVVVGAGLEFVLLMAVVLLGGAGFVGMVADVFDGSLLVFA
jgi:hypothetical protein